MNVSVCVFEGFRAWVLDPLRGPEREICVRGMCV